MAYRRPAIEVVQEFQNAAAAQALPSLPACIVGPAFQIVDDANAGVYSEDDLFVTSYSYPDLASGAVVDLTATPADEAKAGVHKAVDVKLKDAYLIKLPASPALSRITGTLATPNKFQDVTLGAFSSIDPTAVGAPTYYVDIIGGSGINAADIGRKLVIGKTDDNELIVAAEWLSSLPFDNAEYRILEFRASESIPNSLFSSKGIAADLDSVDINPGLTSVTGSLRVVEASILLSWRALRPDLAGKLNAFTTLTSLEAEFGVGTIVPANVGPYAVNLALLNTSTPVNFTGLGANFFSAEEASWQTALEYLESKDVYAIAVLSDSTVVHQYAKDHATQMSASTVGRERVVFVGRSLEEIEVMVPPSGIGTVTSAGANNGTQVGTQNKSFKDPTNGQFITDSVGVGDLVEITSYTAVGGAHRTVTPNERDFFKTTGDHLRINNAAFVAGDQGKYILVRGATTAGNNKPYFINSVSSSVDVVASVAPAANEVMPALARAWIAALDRAVTVVDSVDNVDKPSRVWTFTNGAFTTADIGKMFYITGTVSGNDGPYTIGNVTGTNTIVTIEEPAATETFVAVVPVMAIYSVVREPARDPYADSVDGPSHVWTIRNAIFTDDDIGRTVAITDAQQGANNSTHVIEAVLSTTSIRTSNATTPATEEFDGQVAPITITINSVTPSATEAAYITGTRHKIAAIVSESQLTLATDPTAGFGGTLNAVVYRVTRDMTLDEQAEFLAGYASSLASRRTLSCQPDTLAVSVNNTAVKVPGYMAGGVYAGLTAGLPSQAGFTNLAITGLVGRENSDDKFSDVQLDVIAGGGNIILTQPVASGALVVRHQLTTDVTTIYYQEYSVTKNVDLLSRFFRNLFLPFIGTHNITDTLLDILKTRFDGGTSFLLKQRVPKYGAPIRSAELSRIEESTTEPDSVEMDIEAGIPLPLNRVKITLFV